MRTATYLSPITRHFELSVKIANLTLSPYLFFLIFSLKTNV
uniref:Uncharacterized protein n=1 Tax=Rhizophora mucronata TaxID=61149 RepID=A0A2P2QAQ3_RHIMU